MIDILRRLRISIRFIGNISIFAIALALMGGISHAGPTTYSYDALGRLVSVTNPNSTVTTYTYDAAGNRTAVTTGTGGSPPPPPPPPPPPANNAPVCNNSTITIPAPSYVTVPYSYQSSTFTALCSDADGNALTVTSPPVPGGIPTYGGNTYTIPFTVTDGLGGNGSATITIIRP